MEQYIAKYVKAINTLYMQGNTTEHSFRGALETLLKSMTGFAVVNEAKHIACGAPDLTLLSGNIPVGYVEAKDIGKNLNDKSYKNQFDRYKKALDNLIITDYLTFQLFEGEKSIAEVSIGKILSDKIEPVPKNFNAFIEMIRYFLQYNGKPIANSKQLAEFMAAKTRLLTEVIEKTLNDESALRAQLQDFQEVLLPAMDNAQFADMYAQTIAYGMFVARLQNNSNADFTRQQAANLIPKSNPFLRKLFQYIAGYDIDENICWIVDSLADMFNYVDIDAIHREFISKDKDPFLHFYEDFLTIYDKNLKNTKGAYYTPQAVVRFIVNAVDDILKADFNLVKGLADNSKVCINDKEYHKVQILDPATGTGTFLAEVVRRIYQKFTGNEGAWDDYVSEHLIPRLNGFEIMMSPYTMAHLKIETILQEFGHNATDNQRLRIYLTDSLEEPKQHVQKLGLYKWLSDEAAEAQKIKNNIPVMVILGNPPYSGESQNKSKDKKKRNWIETILDVYKIDDKGIKIPDTKWVNNDYVKFIRFGQHFIHKNGEGILAYITDNSFLDSLSFRGMRYNLLKEFDKIYILNLHGNSLKKETAPDSLKDENVFDIMQGVSINIFVKTGKKNETELANTYYFDLYGKRQKKYNFLLENNLQSIGRNELQPAEPDYFFVPKDFSLQEEYEKGFKIHELFYLNGVGICSKRDETAFQNSKNEIIAVLNDFKNLPESEIKQKYKTEMTESRDKKTAFAKQNILNLGIDEKSLQKVTYRPFETKWTYFTNKSKGFLAYPVYDLMQHFTKGENFGMVVGKQCDSDWRYVFITKNIADLNLIATAAKFGGGYVFPLYLYHDDFGQTEKAANLNKAIVAKFPSFGGAPEGRGGRNTQNYMQLPYNSSLKERARELRKAGNLSEVLFWNKVKNKQFKGYDFDRQKIVGNYIVDFFCANCNVAIEIDGNNHDNKQEYDAARDAFLQSVGLTVIHIPDIDIKKRLDDVMEMLHSHAALQAPLAFRQGDTTTPPSGYPSKGGELCPEQIFDYIYAVLHSPSYREKYKEFLKIDFPRIPYPKNAEQFNKFAAFGERLRHLHLMENITVPDNFANFPISGDNKVENSFTSKSNDYRESKVWINDTQYFDNVSEIAWNFYIGGYQPAQKWLKDRKNRTLTYEDIEHYQKIIFILNETDMIMKEIT